MVKFIFFGIVMLATISLLVTLFRGLVSLNANIENSAANARNPMRKINTWGEDYEKVSLSVLSRAVLIVITTPFFAFIALKFLGASSDDNMAISVALLITLTPLFVFLIFPLLNKINKNRSKM